MEPGELPIPLEAGAYSLEMRNGQVVFHAWNDVRSLARRITGMRLAKRGALDVVIQRFGGKAGRLTFYDQERAAGVNISLRGSREVLLEAFRKMLRRQFPGWRLDEITTGADLEHSLSPAFPRALLSRGGVAWAALAAGPHSEASRALTSA